MDAARSNQRLIVVIFYLIVGVGIFFPRQLGLLTVISSFVPAVAMIHVAWWIICRRIRPFWAIFPFAFWGAFLSVAIASRYEAGHINAQIVSSNRQAIRALPGNRPLIFSGSHLAIELGYRYNTPEIYIESRSKSMIVLRDGDCHDYNSAVGGYMGSGKRAACGMAYASALPSIAIRVSEYVFIPVADRIQHRRFNSYQFFRADLTSPDGTTHSINAAKTAYVWSFPAVLWSCASKDLACGFMWGKTSSYLGGGEPIDVAFDKGHVPLDAAMAHAFGWPSRL